MDSKNQVNAAEIKSIITSLLISNPFRCTIQQLAKDFLTIEGRPVPFRNLGFNSLEEYLLSIPDVIKVHGTGQYAEVEGVITSKSQHINEMVLKQKKNKNASAQRQKKTPRRHSNSKLSWYYSAQFMHNKPKLPQPLSSVENCNTPCQSKANAQKTVLFKITDTSSKSMSKSVRDGCQTKFVGGDEQSSSYSRNSVTEDTSLQTKFVCDNDKSSSYSRNSVTDYSSVKPEYNHLSDATNFKSLTPSCNYIPTFDFRKYSPDNSKNLPTRSNLVEETINAARVNSVKLEPKPNSNYIPKFPIVNTIKSPIRFKDIETTNNQFEEAINIAKFNSAREWNKSHFTPISFKKLEMTDKLLEEGVNLSKLDSIKELNESQDHAVATTANNIASTQTDILNDTLYSDDDLSNIPSTIRRNLKVLIKYFPDGIKCTDLPSEYKKMFGKKLRYEKYDYRSLIEMCSDLPDIFRYVQQSTDDYTLFDCSKPINSLPKKFCEKKVIEPSEIVATKHIIDELPNLTWDSDSPLIPSDIIRLSDEIGRFFPSDVAVGDVLDVSIGEIYDLSKFWLYMTYGDLQPLMHNLQVFYEKNKDRYKIPEQLLEDSLYCVTLFGSLYHRCVIVNLLPKMKGFVRVLYIDYGTVANVAIDKIWFLTKEFGNSPCQAIRARLSNIYPIYENRPWTQKAIIRFEKLVVDQRVLVAEVTKIDKRDHILEVYLADITNENNIFYINDIFVKEGLAFYTDQERKKTFIDYECLPNVRYIHLYPHFCEIEAGLAPTTEEMKYIVANKVPLHHFMSQYFDIYYFEDIESIQNHYEMIYKKQLPEVTIPVSNSDYEFDLSFFPECIRDIIRDIYDEDEDCTLPKKIETKMSKDMPGRGFSNRTLWFREKNSESGKSETSTNCDNDSVKEYVSSNSVSPAPPLSSCSYNSQEDSRPSTGDFLQEVVSLKESLQQDTVASSLSINANVFVPRHSTNPFIDDCTPIETNPFRATNPFITDLQETVTNSEVLEIFAKPSDNKLSDRIINNLTETHDSNKCTKTKQTNVEKVDAESLAVVQPIVKEPPATTEGRIRTPPGFSSREVQTNIPPQPNLNVPYNHYQYYCPVPIGTQFSTNPTFYPQNQLRAMMTQPYLSSYYNNVLPQVIAQNPYNFNLPTWPPLFTTQNPYYHRPPFRHNNPDPKS